MGHACTAPAFPGILPITWISDRLAVCDTRGHADQFLAWISDGRLSYWRDTLLPAYGNWSYPLAMGFIMLEMIIITAIWTPVVFVVFRYLGGAKESGGLLRAFQGFVYGLTPCLFGGFLPYLALATGVYATLLQFYRGPAITLKNRTVVPFLFVTLFLALAIARYWAGGLL
jgi:hypothetical protein